MVTSDVVRLRKRAGPPMVDPKKPKPRAKLNVTDRARLHLETLCAMGTIRRWELGLSVTEATSHRLEQACKRLGIQVFA